MWWLSLRPSAFRLRPTSGRSCCPRRRLVFGWALISVSLTNVHVERRSTSKGCTDCRAKVDLAGLCAIMLLMTWSGGIFQGWHPCNQRAVRSAKNWRQAIRRYHTPAVEERKMCYVGRHSHWHWHSLTSTTIFTYKLVFGLVDLNVHDLFICSFEKVRRGHGYKLFLPTCHSSTRFNFFAHRVLRTWNVLPHDTDFSSLAGFKRSLNTNILQKFLKVYFNWF